VSKYGMIYASAGKNFGPAGVCLCIVKDELLRKAEENRGNIPATLSWNEYGQSTPTHSIYNTPAIFQLFMIDLTMQRVYGERFGFDMEKVGKWTTRRANTIYEIMDEYPQVYRNDVEVECRSNMNIPFRCWDYAMDRVDSVREYKFLKEAEEDWNLHYLEGHHLHGGMRVSLYAGIPDGSIKEVAKFMKYFAHYHSGND